VHNRQEWKKLLRMARNRYILHMPMEWININTSPSTVSQKMSLVQKAPFPSLMTSMYSHASLNDGGYVLRHASLAILSLCKRHRMYLHKPWNLTLTWPPYGWKSFQASVSGTGRFHPYWKFGLASNFPPRSAYLEFPKILTTITYAVCRWSKHRYVVHDCIFNMRGRNRRDKRS
jgi:hypothetical protein